MTLNMQTGVIIIQSNLNGRDVNPFRRKLVIQCSPAVLSVLRNTSRMMEIILAVVLILVLANLALGVILWLRVRNLYFYPALLGFPVIGNLFYFYRTLFLGSGDSMEKYLALVAEKYGDNGLCFHWINGFKLVALVSSPEVLKKLTFHPDLLDKPHVIYGGYNEFFKGPFSSLRSDDLWKIKKKEYSSCLKRSLVDNQYFNSFIKCSNKLVDMVLSSPSSVDPHVVTLCVTEEVSLDTLFEIETSLIYDPEVIKVMNRMMEIGSIIGANGYITRLLSPIVQPLVDPLIGKAAELRKIVLDMVDNSNTEQCPHPELPLVKRIITRGQKANSSANELLNELQELFFTSAHTVASSLSNSIIFLALLPDIQERAWNEQYEIFGNDSREPTTDDLKLMKFLDRCIKESMRFLGPPFNAKTANVDVTVDGLTIPRGAVVLQMSKYMRMDPKYWKNPNVFDPDRFLDDEQSDLLKYMYTPFGIGNRSCPGMYFALTFMKIALSKVLRRLKLRPVDKDFRFENLKYKSTLLVGVENPPELEVEERTRFL